MTGQAMDEAKMLRPSRRAWHNLQRLMCYWLGGGTRKDDMPPFRAVGPVTKEEYLSRTERYDKQLKDLVGLDPSSMTLEERWPPSGSTGWSR